MPPHGEDLVVRTRGWVRVLPALGALALMAVLLGLEPVDGRWLTGILVAAVLLLAIPLQIVMVVVPADEVRFTSAGVVVRRRLSRHHLPVPWEVVREVRPARWLGMPAVLVRIDSTDSDRIIVIPLGTGVGIATVLATVRGLAPGVLVPEAA